MYGSKKFKHDEERLESHCKLNKVDYQPRLSHESNDDASKRRRVLNLNIMKKLIRLERKQKWMRKRRYSSKEKCTQNESKKG